jgi:riboflavin synthase
VFTGLVEAIGSVSKIERRGASTRIAFGSPWGLTEIKAGDSIAVNGACLTVVDVDEKTFTADVSSETIARTTLGELKPTDPVNLERPLTPADRLGGHLVLGHVDGMATITGRQEEGGFITITFRTSEDLLLYIVEKGSVAVDGVSLTVNECKENGFSVAIIPLTSERTIISRKRVGDKVNIETDIIGKYVQRFLSGQQGEERAAKSGLDMDFLAKHGFK